MSASAYRIHSIINLARSRRTFLLLFLLLISVGLQVALTKAQDAGGTCGYGYGYGCSVPCSTSYYYGYGYGYHYVDCDGYVGCNSYASCAGTVNGDGYIGCSVQQEGYSSASASAYVYCDFNNPYSIRCDAYVNWNGVGCDGYQGCTGVGCDGYPGCTGVGCDGYPDCNGVGCDGYPDCTGVGCDGYPGCTGVGCDGYPGCTGVGCDGYTGGGVGGDGYGIYRPDLVVSESHAPAVITKGGLADISWTVTNAGSGPAMLFPWMYWWNDGAYLSADMVIDSGDKLLAYAKSPSYVVPGGSYSAAVSQYVFNIPGGQYNLLVKSDLLGVVNESNKDNNVLVGAPVTIEGSDPDLVMTATSAPAIIEKGIAFEIEARVENQGQGPGLVESQTSPVWYNYYLSSDAHWDNGADYQLNLGSGLMPAGFSLAPGESIDASKVVSTGNVSLGDYYLLAVADPDNGALESDETNNVTVVRQVQLNGPQPDLSQPWLDPIPNVLYAGDLLPLKWGVSNFGTTAAVGQGCTPADWIFLSSDAQLSNEDTVIASALAPSYLAMGSAYWRERTWWVPPTLWGNYYIIAVSDITHCVAEADEDNNTTVIPIEIRPQPPANPLLPDLTVTALDVDEFVHAEATETVKWTVRNIGSTTVGSWYDAAFLSLDGTLDGGDARLGSKSHTGSLVKNQAYSTNMDVGIPAGTPEGDYKLILRADENAANTEYDYGNNILVKDIVVDNTPMLISDVEITPACGGAVVSWETSEPAESFIHWWDVAGGWHYKHHGTPKTSHSMTLTGFSTGKAASAQIVALDRARNVAEHDVDFIATIGMPGLSASRGNVYWDDYAAFEQRLLTVDYLMTNKGDTEAIGVAVDATTDTNGVTLGVNTPVAVGHLAAGQARSFSLKYYVPPNVSSFHSRIHASTRDACGTGYTYP